MKLVKCIMIASIVVCLTGKTTFASSIAAKAWYAEATDIKDPALLYGLTGSLSLSENLWISAMFLTGTYDGENDAGLPILDVDTTDAEVVLGYSFEYIDIGIGGRVSQWKWQNIDDDFLIFGPMVYAGLGDSIGDTPIGWYLGGSYMFKDFGDAYDKDWDATYEHYNIEGGISLALDPLSATIGYRIKEYTDSEVDLDFKGVAATLGFGF